MKLLIIGNRDRHEKYRPDLPAVGQVEVVYCERDAAASELLAVGGDADFICADAISRVDAELIGAMPNLKLIHSEGVAYNAIDTAAAAERGIYVCNSKGCNAGAVAELAIMLMLELLRKGVSGDQAVREGQQITVKERAMVEGITELSECRVGLVGLGDIGMATATRLLPFGCELVYYSPHRKSPEIERQCGLTYLPLTELAATSDIVSIHTAVTPATVGLFGAELIGRMKPTAYLINTARGEIIDNEALRAAIVAGRLGGAGLDVLDPEPFPADHPLVDLPKEFRQRIVFTPHLGGITGGSFRRSHRIVWENIGRMLAGEPPVNVVNGVRHSHMTG